jgi:hypothetical protein
VLAAIKLSILLSLSTGLTKMAGGSENDDLTREIMSKLAPYLDQSKDAYKHLSQHLIRHFNSGRNTELKVKSIDEGPAPNLRDQIQQLVRIHNFQNVSDFIDKSAITYMAFLPDNKKSWLLESLKVSEVSSEDREKTISALKKVNVPASEADTLASEILKYYRLYKLKDKALKGPLSTIKKKAKSAPLDIFELDMIGMTPKIHQLALQYNDSKSSESQALEKIRRYLEELHFLDKYSIYLSKVLTLQELEDKLRQAARYSERREPTAERRDAERRDAERRDAERRDAERRDAERRDAERRDAKTIATRAHEAEAREAEAREEHKESEMEQAFYERLKEDPELEEVAKAMDMSLHDLYEQYKLEEAAKIAGGGVHLDNIDPRIVDIVKKKLMHKLSFRNQ